MDLTPALTILATTSEGGGEAATGGLVGLLVPLVLILPLLGFVVTAAIGRRLDREAHWIPVGVVVLSWALAMIVCYAALSGGLGDAGHHVELFEWIPAGDFQVTAGLFVDNLTACLLIVVTTIGMLVHVYSIGYMAHDPGYWRFFAYLNLFMFSMLLLVLADNWLVLFVAWELVGLSSYLLIGFWYRRRSAALASKKAFIVNRVGDIGFALGIIAIWVNTHTLDVRASMASLTGEGGSPVIPIWVVALLVFAGAVGKSAQFPLHVWLPDAMEGPTPVSALIHAATMVNAGVYLVARANPIFAAAPGVLVFVAAIGIFTAILAASIAMTQTDIKRVLAYSTLSQLGYMFAALGVGAFTAAIFHLMTHGFFKGLLFLGSGSVIHAVHDEQDMRRMGGLAKKIPHTYRTMLIGSLAIAGIPPLAGFFSKDEILAESWKFGFEWVWAIGVFVAILTAFYMFRLIGLTFWGESRVDPHVEPRVHESPPVMTGPLWALAIPTIVLGAALGLPFGDGPLHHWLEDVFHGASVALGQAHAEFALLGIDGVLILVSVAAAALGIAVAWLLFGVEMLALRRRPRPEMVRSLAARLPFLYRASLNKWWFDDLYDLLFVRIGGRIAAALWWFDREVVDGTVNAVGALTRGSGSLISRVQTGRVQNYALGIALGLIVMAASYLIIAGRPA
ncbi:MAG TPA: NADH-quinone oxidoreductase subunit L [Candidatus Limnocylindrales bacterium]|jgi:NADH-quinone oxidoreductase subunit L|nr:NADH-quinone oxidoreductase subunit L [Candidatus Limnocylindrales bacterium]